MHVERDVSKVSESLVMMTIQISYNEKKNPGILFCFFFIWVCLPSVCSRNKSYDEFRVNASLDRSITRLTSLSQRHVKESFCQSGFSVFHEYR